MSPRRETPYKRTYPSGKVRWVARFTRPDGSRDTNGTFELKRDAQDAINQAYEDQLRGAPETLGAYAETWTTRRPRSARTNETNDGRVRQVLDVKIEGLRLRDWPLRDLKRRHALDLVDRLLRDQGRAASGAVNILRSLSALAEDAITDELCDTNPFRGVKIRGNDPRITKTRRPVRVFRFEQMHAFAEAAGAPARLSGGAQRSDTPRRTGGAAYDQTAVALVRTIADTGMRLGEVLGLRRADLDAADLIFTIVQTAHAGRTFPGTKSDRLRDQTDTIGRIAPCPPGLLDVIRQMPPRIDTDLLFPTPSGHVWSEQNFYRDLWRPTQRAAELDIRPHEMRHSWVTHLQAAGINDADLADMAGHSIQMLLGRYTHPLKLSYDQVRDVIG